MGLQQESSLPSALGIVDIPGLGDAECRQKVVTCRDGPGCHLRISHLFLYPRQ